MPLVAESVTALALPQHLADAISHGVAGAPGRETCGFLLGCRTADEVLVRSVRPAENIYNDRNHFAISQRDFLAVLSAATPSESLVGLYHIHYGPARPSCDDIRNMSLHPLLWLIIGVSSQSFHSRCFTLTAATLRKVPIHLV